MKTIISLLFASVLFSSIAAFAQAQPLPPPQPSSGTTTTNPTPQQPSDLLMGDWISTQPLYNRETTIYISFRFTPTTMTLGATCTYQFQNAQLSTAAIAPVAYSQNNLEILQEVNASVNDGYRYCNVGLQPTVWQFYFDGAGNAVLFAQVPYGVRFNLIRPPQPQIN